MKTAPRVIESPALNLVRMINWCNLDSRRCLFCSVGVYSLVEIVLKGNSDDAIDISLGIPFK